MQILPWVYLWLDKICWLTCVTFMALNVCLYLGRILVYNSSLYYCKSKLRLYNIIKKIHNFLFYIILVFTRYLYISKMFEKIWYIFYVSIAWKMILRTTFESLIIHWINVLAKRFDFTFAVDSFYIYTYFRSSNWNGIKSSV